MVNNVVVIGRITREVNVVTLDSGKKVSEVCIAVQRNFKNFEGSYDVDFIHATLWEGLASIVSSYCTKGSMVSIVGRLQVKNVHVDDKKFNVLELIAESIGLIDSKPKSTSQEQG
ncbi:MAG: single-stranded DNA-binding protein [Acholeplasmatales bacterium]|jgi:single-strand DNA-binding protein|nr:single-stranded DNA-binding protein [Acholeplasmatales bacterium]